MSLLPHGSPTPHSPLLKGQPFWRPLTFSPTSFQHKGMAVAATESSLAAEGRCTRCRAAGEKWPDGSPTEWSSGHSYFSVTLEVDIGRPPLPWPVTLLVAVHLLPACRIAAPAPAAPASWTPAVAPRAADPAPIARSAPNAPGLAGLASCGMLPRAHAEQLASREPSIADERSESTVVPTFLVCRQCLW